MKYPTKHQQVAYDVDFFIGLCLVGSIAGVSIGWLFAECLRALVRGSL